MDRRQLLRILGATPALAMWPAAARAQPGPVVISLGAPVGAAIPRDFLGLSYEAAQLANPAFFSPANIELVALFRGLSPAGSLRIGGGSSEFTTYSAETPAGPPPFEIFGPDTSKTVKHGTVTSALALTNLRGFLDATGWSCLYGLNLGQGTRENAALEAAAVQRILGPRLTALQIGNEPDSFRNRYRPAAWGPVDFLAEWNDFHAAIVAAAPGVRFAGPDISNKLPFLTAFAAEAPRHPDVTMLTLHYYAMGPARSPDATLEQLMLPDPLTATLHLRDLPVVAQASATAGLPVRISEGSSCWDGGKPFVSDTLASALWCADAMLAFAQRGWVGVNWHGGGNGFYTPIAGAPSTGFARRPAYFGMQFVQALTGARFLASTSSRLDARVGCYALEHDGKRKVAVINKTDAPVELTLPGRVHASASMLTGRSLVSRDGVTLAQAKLSDKATVSVPAHSAILYTLRN